MHHQTHEQLAARQQQLVAEHEELGSFVESVEIGVLSASVRDPRSSRLHDEVVNRARVAAEKRLAPSPNKPTAEPDFITATIRACEQAGLKPFLPQQETLEQLDAKLRARRDEEERERLRRLLGF